jgi:hypothetical protein
MYISESSAVKLYNTGGCEVGSGGKWSEDISQNNSYSSPSPSSSPSSSSSSSSSSDEKNNIAPHICDGVVVDVEIDMEKKGISYWIDGVLSVWRIIKVTSTPLLFGLCGVGVASEVEVVSLQRMKRSSLNPSLPFHSLDWS